MSISVLLRTLEDLTAEEFKKFKWFLWHKGELENLPAIPVNVLENADRMDTVTKMFQTYCNDTIKVTVMVLKKMSRNDLVQNIQETMKEPAGKTSIVFLGNGESLNKASLHQIEMLHMTTGKPEQEFVVMQPLICSSTDLPFTCYRKDRMVSIWHKPAADGHQLTTTKRSADDWMDTKGKRSVATVTLVLLGVSGTGKSATGNTILGEQRFLSMFSSKPITRELQMEMMNIDNTHVRLIDTPDVFDDDMKSSVRDKLVARCKQLCGSDPLVYLLVIHVSRFTDGERDILEKMENMFGREAPEKTVILFTHGGDLENSDMSFQDFLDSCQPKLREIIQKCGNRCVLFENKNKNQSSQQAKELMRMVFRLLDHQFKKSIVLLGNGKSLKKALITIILGKDLSSLKKTILSRTQVYEDNVYKFICTPDLDKDCEYVREAFSWIQRPYKSLLVVEDDFIVSDVWRQIEKLKMMTGKPEQDFVVVLPLTCKNTNQPFRCCSVDQLIRELQKPAAHEHQLTTTRRPADHLMDTTGKRSVATVTLVLLGMAGTGKSATGNTILGEKRFHSMISSMPVTREVQVESTNISNTHVRLIDTPDVFDDIVKSSDRNRHVDRCKQLCGSDPLVYLLVMYVSRLTDGERESLEKLEKMFGRGAKDKTVILFTRSGDLQNANRSLQDFVHRCQPKLKEIIHKCSNRCVLFENSSQSSQQVNELMETVFRLLDDQRKRSVATVTLVLLGMAGTGKSATGNTILGEQRFHSMASSMPVTRELQVESMNISNTHVRLIDTPDLFDDDMKSSDRQKLVDRCKQLCRSDPLVYLLVMRVSRFTDGERDILEKLEKMFGREAKEKTVILFTRGGDLENADMSFQDFLDSCQPKLKEIIQKCGNRCVLFENKNQSSLQVNELMETVFRLLDDQSKW